MNSDKPKILILCNDFPPVNSIGSDRPYSWYNYFKDYDLYPVVITKNWVDSGNSRFKTILPTREEEISPKGTIIRAKKIMTPSLWITSTFGLRLGIIRRLFTLIEKLFGFNIFLLDQHRQIYKEAFKYLENNNVKLVISTGEPFILFKYGSILKRKYKIKWIADYRDGWYLNHVTSIKKNSLIKLIRNVELKAERKYIKDADLITTIDPFLADRLEKFTKIKTEYVYNGFWNHIKLKNTAKQNQNKLILNHTGTLTNGQRIEILLDVLVYLKGIDKISEHSIELNLVGLEYFPNQMERIKKYKKKLKGILVTTPRLKKEDANKMNLRADYLINFTDENYTAIYAKTYNYIACGKPILVIPGDNGLLDDIVTKHNLGTILNTATEIEDFITNPDVDFKPNPKNLEFFTRRNQTKRMSEIIKTELIKHDKT